jgi:hypothetical protein
MDGCVNKMVRFVNIITDICQFFVDIYQFLYKNKLAGAEKKRLNVKIRTIIRPLL